MGYQNPIRYGGAGLLAYTLEYILVGESVFLASYLVGPLVLHGYLIWKEDENRSWIYIFLGSFLSPFLFSYGIMIWILESWRNR